MFKNYRKSVFILFLLFCVASAGGCAGSSSGSSESEAEADIDEDSGTSETAEAEQLIYECAGQAAQVCSNIVSDKAFSSTTDRPGTMQKLLDCLASAGYCAADTDNGFNMTNYEQMDQFCSMAAQGETAEADLVLLMGTDGFVYYHFSSENGEMDIERCTFYWAAGEPGYYEPFRAERWEYTEKGYFFFDQHRMPGYDGPPGEIGVRVKPLDENCLLLNEKYVRPIGYSRNNVLISDWSESDDFGSLNFYDLFDLLYNAKYGKNVPYLHEFSGAEYEIPATEFENVLTSYLNISTSLIRSRTTYLPDTDSYLYHPRGLNDAEYPYGPYSEVTAWEELGNGTLKLTVDAVWVTEFSDQAVTSELTVRPLSDGSFQYVSNQVTYLQDGVGGIWYSPRLTEEEWRTAYGQ